MLTVPTSILSSSIFDAVQSAFWNHLGKWNSQKYSHFGSWTSNCKQIYSLLILLLHCFLSCCFLRCFSFYCCFWPCLGLRRDLLFLFYQAFLLITNKTKMWFFYVCWNLPKLKTNLKYGKLLNYFNYAYYYVNGKNKIV